MFISTNILNMMIEIAHMVREQSVHLAALGLSNSESVTIVVNTDGVYSLSSMMAVNLKPRIACPFPTKPEHVAFMSRAHAGQVAFIARNYCKGKHETMKIGKYLKKYFPELSDDVIRTYAENAQASPVVFRTDVAQAYQDSYEKFGLRSCMAYKPIRYQSYPRHPMEIFEAAGCYAVACLFNDEKMVARALVNTKTKKFPFVYGVQTLKDELIALGYEYASFDGDILPAIELNSGGYLFPWIDTKGKERDVYMSFDFDGDSFTLSDSRGEFSANSTEGVFYLEGQCQCGHCGDRMHEDDGCYVESEDSTICDHCLNRYYVRARTRHGHYEYVRDNHAIETTDGEYFVDADAAIYHDYVALENGDWVSINDAFCCHECDEWILADDAVIVQGGDNECVCEYCANHNYTKVFDYNGDSILFNSDELENSDFIQCGENWYEDSDAAKADGFHFVRSQGEFMHENDLSFDVVRNEYVFAEDFAHCLADNHGNKYHFDLFNQLAVIGINPFSETLRATSSGEKTIFDLINKNGIGKIHGTILARAIPANSDFWTFLNSYHQNDLFESA